MGIFSSFKITFGATFEVLLLAGFGFFLVKRKILSGEGLSILSRLVVEFTLPLFIFSQLITRFTFSLYRYWWIFPILSIVITFFGLGIGYLFLKMSKETVQKREFLSLVTFQNSGYLPLILVATLLSPERKEEMFIYIFLFLLGFNLIIWSFGVWFLTRHKIKNFELGSLFSPPVLATLSALILILLGINRFIPQLILRPARMIGDCTLPLAMLVIGGSLAEVSIKHIEKKTMFNLILAKLFVMPVLALAVLLWLKPAPLIGFLVILQAAMPSATSLVLITRHYNIEDRLISQGVFFSHLASIATIPLFLSLYWMFAFLF